MTTESPKIRELFIEELAQIHAGTIGSEPGNTTMACCEEGPFGCCHILPDVGDIILPPRG